MKVLITGAGGMLGRDLVKTLTPRHEVIPFITEQNSTSNDNPPAVLNESLIAGIFAANKPDVVIHAAAYTDVDGAEQNGGQAQLVNVKGTLNIAGASIKAGAVLFFISTDYVFDGLKSTPYEEDDAPNPLSMYGKTKLAAERELALKFAPLGSIYIIRTSWLFGANGKNFFRSILKAARERDVIRVVGDQKGAPTYTKDFASVFQVLIEKANRQTGCRIYHLANSGSTTWHHAAEALLKKVHFTGKLVAIGSNELGRPAKRPENSVLNLKKVQRDFGIRLRPWEAALDEFWNEVLKHEWES